MTCSYYGTHVRLKEITVLLNQANSNAGNVENLTVYLDGNDYSQNKTVPSAFCWQKKDSYDVESVPSTIKTLMSEPHVTHLIWLSKHLLDRDDIHILWVYSHELRHFMQNQGVVDIVKIKSFLSKLHIQEGFSGNGFQLEIPNELDAELFAKSTVKAIFGHAALLDYISLECNQPDGGLYHQRLEYLERLLSVK